MFQKLLAILSHRGHSTQLDIDLCLYLTSVSCHEFHIFCTKVIPLECLRDNLRNLRQKLKPDLPSPSRQTQSQYTLDKWPLLVQIWNFQFLLFKLNQAILYGRMAASLHHKMPNSLNFFLKILSYNHTQSHTLAVYFFPDAFLPTCVSASAYLENPAGNFNIEQEKSLQVVYYHLETHTNWLWICRSLSSVGYG